MRFKKTAALLLCGVFALGIAGCGKNRRARSGIEGLLDEYVEALQELDEEAVLDLTVWNKKDDEYDYVRSCFVTDGYATYIWDVFETTASTITIDYDKSDLEISKDKATLKVEYRLVDWEPLFDKTFDSSASLVRAINKCDDEITVKGKLEFELDDGEWKISKITKLDKVLDFTDEWPTLSNTEWPTRPVFIDDWDDIGTWDDLGTWDDTDTWNGADTTLTHTSSTNDYASAASDYLMLLESYEKEIRSAEEVFNIKSCGYYDVDNNGVPELFFISGSQPSFCSDFNFYSWRGDSSYTTITIPNIIYQAGSGGLYNVYCTGRTMVISFSHGDDALYTYDSYIYPCYGDNMWVNNDYYSCEVRYGNDEGNGEYAYTYYHYTYYTDPENAQVTEQEYTQDISEYAGEAQIVLSGNYDPEESAADHALSGKPHYEGMSYDEMHAYLESLI